MISDPPSARGEGAARWRAYAMLSVTMLFWAGNTIVARALHADIPPFMLALVRWVGAATVIAPFAIRHVVAERTVIRRAWRPILLLGLTGVAAFNGFLYLGLGYTSASNSLLLQALIPAMVMLVGAVAFRDRVTRVQAAAVSLSAVGVAFIVFRGDVRAIASLQFGYGDMLVLCGCAAWAVYTACLRMRPPIHMTSFLLVTFMIGALAMAPLAIHEADAVARIDWTAEVLGAFAYVAIFPSVIAYFLYNAAVAAIGPAAAGQTISLLPLFGAGLAMQLLDEPLHGYHLAGMTIILAGILAGWRATRGRSL